MKYAIIFEDTKDGRVFVSGAAMTPESPDPMGIPVEERTDAMKAYIDVLESLRLVQLNQEE